MTPNAASSPKEETNGLAEDSLNGAPAAAAKRPVSPAEEAAEAEVVEEEEVKRHKDSEVSVTEPCHQRWKLTCRV